MEASRPETVRLELKRLAAGRARAVGGARAGRWHLILLGAACALAFLHRTLLPLPWLDRVAASWPLLIGVAGGLFAMGPLLRILFAAGARPSADALARDLDDRYGWRDETGTAAALPATTAEGGLARLVVAQTGGRLREIDPAGFARTGRPWTRVRLALALLFIALLVLPGVRGTWDGDGAGTRGGEGYGSAGLEEDFGAPGPMQADFWFQAFVENPIPVEPLPEERAPHGAGEVPAKAGGR